MLSSASFIGQIVSEGKYGKRFIEPIYINAGFLLPNDLKPVWGIVLMFHKSKTRCLHFASEGKQRNENRVSSCYYIVIRCWGHKCLICQTITTSCFFQKVTAIRSSHLLLLHDSLTYFVHCLYTMASFSSICCLEMSWHIRSKIIHQIKLFRNIMLQAPIQIWLAPFGSFLWINLAF